MRQIIITLSLFVLLCQHLYAKQFLSLSDVISLGIKNNPQIKISSKIKEEYFFQKNMIKAKFFPYLYLNYNYQRQDLGRNKPSVDFHYFGPSLTWNIFSGFSDWHAYKEALLLIAAQDENIKSVILNISMNIIQAYLEYFKQKALYEAALTDLKDAKTILKLAKKKYEVGLAPYADVLDAEARVKKAEFNVTNYKYTSEIAKANVLTLINYDITQADSFEFLPVKETDLKAKNLADCIKLGLMKRPELKAKEKEILAQEEKVKEVKGKFLPSINLVSSYYKEDSKFFPDRDYEFTAGIEIQWPIFLGLSRWEELKKERATLEQKHFEKTQTELEVKQEIFTNYKRWQTAKENYESAIAWLKSIEEDYRIIKKKYETGLASIVDLTTTLARLSEARSQVAVSKYNFILSYYNLQKSMGFIPGLEK